MSTNFLKRKKDTKPSERDGEHQSDSSNKRRTKKDRKKRKKARRHAFPIWLRILVVLALVIVCLVLGVIIGYGVIGDGAPLDALKKQTWQHIIDIIIKD